MVNHVIPENRPLFKQWMLSSIKNYIRKRYVQRDTAIEFFLYDGSTFLLNFPNREIESVIERLETIRKREVAKHGIYGLKKKSWVRICKEICLFLYYLYYNSKSSGKQQLTKKWTTRQISNIEYLMKINFLGGRSFRDLA